MKNKTSPYIRHLARQYRAYILLYFLLNFISFPLMIALRMITNQNQNANVHYSLIGISEAGILGFSAGINMILSMASPLLLFRFVFNRNDLDTYFSLPISREKLFLKHFGFAWLLQAAALVLNRLLGLILLLINGGDGFLLRGFWTNLAVMLLGSFFFMIPTMLAVLLTATFFNALFHTALLNILPWILTGFWNLYLKNYKGYSPGPESKSQDGVLMFHRHYFNALQGDSLSLQREAILPVLVTFLIAALLFVLCVRLFKTRKVWRVGSGDMVKGYYPAIISIYGLLILSFFYGSIYEQLFARDGFLQSSNFIFSIFLAFAFYFVVQIIRRNGLPKIGRTIGTYVLILAGALLLTLFMHNVVRKSLVYTHIQPAQVGSIELTTAREYNQYDIRSAQIPEGAVKGEYFYPFGEHTVSLQKEVTDEEEIKQILDWYNAYLDSGFASLDEERYMYYNAEYKSLRLIFRDHGGKIILTRSYALARDREAQSFENVSGFELLGSLEASYGEETKSFDEP